MSYLSKYRYSTEVGNYELLLSVQCVWREVEIMKRSKVVMNIETLKTVSGYCHWIPITQGLHEEYFSENFPGWNWNHFVPKLLDLKILRFRGECDENQTMLLQGLFISSDVCAIEFLPERNDVKVRVITRSKAGTITPEV
jgi:hypothetical protein